MSTKGVSDFKCGLDHFRPPATTQELQEGCDELWKKKILLHYRWVEGDQVELMIRKDIHENYE